MQLGKCTTGISMTDLPIISAKRRLDELHENSPLWHKRFVLEVLEDEYDVAIDDTESVTQRRIERLESGVQATYYPDDTVTIFEPIGGFAVTIDRDDLVEIALRCGIIVHDPE